MLQDELLREARELSASLEEIFIAIHRNPELGNQERATSSLVRRQLELLGIEAVPMAGTGVMGVIRGALPGKCLGFRADMDALPIQEETGLPYASQNPGVMHACGHDFHVAALLGAAELLQRRREALTGTVKLFFQPDEEGDGGGARMIAEGCMENPHVDAVLCCHVESGIPTGTVSLCEGPICAASNPFTLILRGKGTHGAKPHLGSDVIVAGSQMVTALQTIASRRTSPTEPVVVTIGSFQAGTACNVLSEEAHLSGTLRTMGREARERVKEDFQSIVAGVSAAMGVEADLELVEGYPCCDNDPAMTALVRRSAAALLGEENVLQLREPSMGADDFGCFSELVPGCYYYVGVGNAAKGFTSPNHNPHFAVDPAALPIAAVLHARTALDFLGCI